MSAFRMDLKEWSSLRRVVSPCNRFYFRLFKGLCGDTDRFLPIIFVNLMQVGATDPAPSGF